MDESLKTLKYVISIYRRNIVLLCILFSALIRSNRETLIFINNHSHSTKSALEESGYDKYC